MTNTLAYLLPRAALVSQQSRIGKLTSGRPYVSFITGQSAEWTIPYLGLFQGGDISLVIQYATSATSGTVKLSAAIEAISDGDYPVSTLTSFGSATDGEQSLSGQAWQLRSFNCPFSDVDGMNQGRLIRIKITRETDSCTEPVFIVGATLQETLSSFNVDGELILSNPLAVESGGTGATDSTQALTNLLPDQTGNDGYFLQTASGSPQWAELALGDLAYASAPLQASQGGTGLTSLAAHRVLYGAQFGGQAEQSADLTFTASTKRLDLAGSQVITNQVASTIPFRIHGTASQTGLLTDWRNSSNQSVASVSASGTVAATNITTPTETITGTVAATVPLTVQGAVSQSADFVQVKDSSNAKVFAIHADKSVLIPPASTIGQDQTLQ